MFEFILDIKRSMGARDARREQIPSHIEFAHGPGAGVVGDGLVPSRAEFAHGPGAGDAGVDCATVGQRIFLR